MLYFFEYVKFSDVISAAWRMSFINIYYRVDSDNESSQFCLRVCISPPLMEYVCFLLWYIHLIQSCNFNFFTEIASLTLCFVYLYKLELLTYYYISFSLYVWWLQYLCCILSLYDCVVPSDCAFSYLVYYVPNNVVESWICFLPVFHLPFALHARGFVSCSIPRPIPIYFHPGLVSEVVEVKAGYVFSSVLVECWPQVGVAICVTWVWLLEVSLLPQGSGWTISRLSLTCETRREMQ